MTNLENIGSTQAIEDRSRRIIETEIYCNDSVLIHELMKASFAGFTEDHIVNLCESSADVLDRLEYNDPSQFDTISNLIEAGELNEAALLLEADRAIREIYEWWRVSDHLAERLIQICEPVLRNAFGTWWGRTCSGQSILMDGTIQRI